jgi:hypothetical protein
MNMPVGITTTLRTKLPNNRSSIPNRNKKILFSKPLRQAGVSKQGEITRYRGSFSAGKADGARSWTLIDI